MRAEDRLRTIVAATDLSEGAGIAADRAAALARAHGARLVLMHALAPLSPLVDVDPELAGVPAPDPTALEDAARSELEAEAERLRGEGLEITTVLRPGPAPTAVFDVVSECRSDLLVTGTRGLTRFARLLLGSTATRLIRAAPCPVLTIHPEDAALAALPRSIVVGTDFSVHADLVTQVVRRVVSVSPDGVRIALVHAVHVPDEIASRPRLRPHPDRLAQVLRDAQGEVESRAETLRGEGFDVDAVVREGYPPEVLLGECTDRAADLVALGTRGLTGLRRLVLGSTAARVLPNAPCPVLTVHDTEVADV